VSILEVMFAILVTTIGLLGAIAIFPVASAQARKGKLTDMAAVAGISAVHQFDVQQMRNPNTWLYYDTTNSVYKIVGTPTPGTAAFIDPGFMVQLNKSPTLGGQNHDQYSFPYYSLSAGTNIDSNSDKRMTRITLQAFPTTASTMAMSGFQAETIFAVGDDLAYTRPDDRSLNAVQTMVNDGTNMLKRQTEGMLTWAATLAPKIEYDTSGNPLTTDLYILSILVFDRRDNSFPLDTKTTLDDGSNAVNPERLVDVTSFPGGGIGGGEVVLAARPGATPRNAGDLDLRAGDWVMLSGYRNLGGQQIGPLFLWYRVADTDPEVDISSGTPQRYVTLQGPDWPQALTNVSGGNSYTQATLMTGLVAVYEKTIRIDTGN
jgi:hypothetical protein